jgi:hypothetical protein
VNHDIFMEVSTRLEDTAVDIFLNINGSVIYVLALHLLRRLYSFYDDHLYYVLYFTSELLKVLMVVRLCAS